MLDWTGERFVPWAKEAAVAYEHLHRYIWASSLVKDKRVLDLASGEGYGANTLADHASFVCGVDIAEDVVRHASEKYARPNLQFLKGSATRVPISESHSFDVIVCFEALEHIEQHDELLQEIKRLLRPGGLCLVSTPNKEIYSVDKGLPNPFHLKELTFAEFNALLTRYFSNVSYLGQRVYPVSSMWPIARSGALAVQEYAVERVEGEFRKIADGKRSALYFVAVASDAAGAGYPGSVLLDCSDELVKEKEREVAWLQGHVAQRDEALAWRAGQVETLESDVQGLQLRLKSTEDALKATEHALKARTGELAAVHQSRGWKLVLKLRALRDRFAGLL